MYKAYCAFNVTLYIHVLLFVFTISTYCEFYAISFNWLKLRARFLRKDMLFAENGTDTLSRNFGYYVSSDAA